MSPSEDETPASTDTPSGVPRKRLTVFRAADATPVLGEMPVLGIDEGVMAGLQLLGEANPTGDPNHGSKTVVLFREPGDSGMSLAYAWFKSGYILPRHSHDTDCLYYVIAGSLKLGNRVLAKGDGMFIPAQAGYTYEAGPEGVEVLEFRNATQFSFLFRNNTPDHWQRIAEVFRHNTARWDTEIPPSER